MSDFDELETVCVCPKTKKYVTVLGVYLRCPTPCDYIAPLKAHQRVGNEWCPWGARSVEQREKSDREGVAFMCGPGGCSIKPAGMTWEEAEQHPATSLTEENERLRGALRSLVVLAEYPHTKRQLLRTAARHGRIALGEEAPSE